MGEKSKSMYVVMIVIMFILFLSLIYIVFNLTGALFIFELLLLLLFLLLGIVFTAGIYDSRDWVWPAMLVFFGANLINLSFLYFVKVNFSSVILPLLTGVLGFLISLIKKGPSEEDLDEIEEIKSEIKEISGVSSQKQSEIEEKKDAPKVEDIKVNFSPGKYIASETGKKYHIPKCDWAKKINKKRIVWFDDKKEAKKKGYTPCKCVK